MINTSINRSKSLFRNTPMQPIHTYTPEITAATAPLHAKVERIIPEI